MTLYLPNVTSYRLTAPTASTAPDERAKREALSKATCPYCGRRVGYDVFISLVQGTPAHDICILDDYDLQTFGR